MGILARGGVIQCGAAALVAVCAGCATMTGQPKMSAASILPAELKPGDSAVITVAIRDKFHVVKRVEGVVKEDRTIKFNFTDDGVPPDAAAHDGVWTIQVDVPFNAPPGHFEFEVSGYDERGEVVVVDDKQHESAPLSTSASLVIHYPEEPAPAATGGKASDPLPVKP